MSPHYQPEVATCIFTGAPGEDPEDCTTHDHEEAEPPDGILAPSISYSDTQPPQVNARELHAFLESGWKFADWIATRVKECDFVEDEDFGVCVSNSRSKECGEEGKRRGGHNVKEYWLTLDAAKEFSMLERNNRGKLARRYFIDCEKRLRNRPAVQAIDFSDPLTTAKLYIEAEEGKRLALAELSTTRLTLDTTTKQLGRAVIEKDEQTRKSDAIGRAVAREKESKILSGWLKEVSRITGVGPNRGLKILQAYGILCRKKVEGCSNTDEPGITTPYLDKEWLCYKLQPAVGKTITEDKIGDDGEVVAGADGKPEKVVVEVLDAAGDQVQVNSRTVKVTPKGCEHILKLLSTCDETLLWRLIDLVKVPELRVLRGRYTFSEHHNFAHKMFPKSSDTVRRMIRFVKPAHPFEIWVAWIYAESTGPEKLVGRGYTLEQAYRELAKVVAAY
jgi:phage anti-repressor protein